MQLGFEEAKGNELQFQFHEGIMKGRVGLLRGNPKKVVARERDRIEDVAIEGADQTPIQRLSRLRLVFWLRGDVWGRNPWRCRPNEVADMEL